MNPFIFSQPAEIVAPQLLGCELIVRGENGIKAGGIIVETEAYDQTDEASHTFRGETTRNAAMFGEPGTVYIYLTYGMHLCMNFSVDRKGYGTAVLIRAIEPTLGVDTMWQRRFEEPLPKNPPQKKLIQLTNGPAKLTQALGVTLADNHQKVGEKFIVRLPKHNTFSIIRTTRIGISKEVDKPLRWYIKSNDWVSKP